MIAVPVLSENLERFLLQLLQNCLEYFYQWEEWVGSLGTNRSTAHPSRVRCALIKNIAGLFKLNECSRRHTRRRRAGDDRSNNDLIWVNRQTQRIRVDIPLPKTLDQAINDGLSQAWLATHGASKPPTTYNIVLENGQSGSTIFWWPRKRIDVRPRRMVHMDSPADSLDDLALLERTNFDEYTAMLIRLVSVINLTPRGRALTNGAKLSKNTAPHIH